MEVDLLTTYIVLTILHTPMCIWQADCSFWTYTFTLYQEFQYMGCLTRIYPDINHLGCARLCLDSRRCPSYVYSSVNRSCVICTEGYSIKGVTFESGQGSHLLTKMQWRAQQNYTNNLVRFDFPGTILPGEMETFCARDVILATNDSATQSSFFKNQIDDDQYYLDALIQWSNNTEKWPDGSYALLKPVSGCPRGDSENWSTGDKMIQSESTSDIHSLKNSEKSHLSRPLFKTVDQVNYVILRYCVKTTSTLVNQVSWPSGSYCINKKLSCPLGFQEGKVYIDEEDSYGNKGLVKGTVPDDNSSSKHSFCCRNDSRPDTPISLPNKSPFYLNRKGGKCQQVVGMSVEEDFVLIDSENDMNDDEYSGSFNDVKINDVIFYLCYYRPLYIGQI
ncbi:uncharacterized protein LOC106064172 [Biomphalaria glabrata]|uniref:Uncharacterized protein LOC106064172 n=1 Tax=Biomphalaria glabrata TaxID=6526 RepID=A0A9W3BQ83_BIOGL|nr:uncharacterized protein LOC106064172 [Biomphalaria glabrata]